MNAYCALVLDDAKFFFNEDRKKPLIDRQDGLTKIVFQEGLGNLADKTERLLNIRPCVQ